MFVCLCCHPQTAGNITIPPTSLLPTLPSGAKKQTYNHASHSPPPPTHCQTLQNKRQKLPLSLSELLFNMCIFEEQAGLAPFLKGCWWLKHTFSWGKMCTTSVVPEWNNKQVYENINWNAWQCAVMEYCIDEILKFPLSEKVYFLIDAGGYCRWIDRYECRFMRFEMPFLMKGYWAFVCRVCGTVWEQYFGMCNCLNIKQMLVFLWLFLYVFFMTLLK